MKIRPRNDRPGSVLNKELSNMSKRIVGQLSALVAVALCFLALPVPSASAAPSPWWQIVTGSHPTNLWIPQNQVQEIVAPGTPFILAVNGELVGFFNESTAEEIQTALEAKYGVGDVTVTGGPAGAEPFIVTSVGDDAGRSVPPIEILAPPVFEFRPVKQVQAGGSGRLVTTLINLGDAPLDATSTPLKIVDKLPEGVEATGGVVGIGGVLDKAGDVECEVEAVDLVSCSFEGELAPFDAIEIEIPVNLEGDPPAEGKPGKVTVSGGNGPTASATREINVSPEETPFGLEHFSSQIEEEGGASAITAGGHPFQLTTTVQFNSGRFIAAGSREDSSVEQPAQPRNVNVTLPAGFVGNLTTQPKCSMADFYEKSSVAEGTNQCPVASAIGATSVSIVIKGVSGLGFVRPAVPVFNLPPAAGEPARFGFMISNSAVIINTKVDPDNKYRIIASVNNGTQLAQFLSATVTLWGTPGDPRHDDSRGWACVYKAEDAGPCERPPGLGEEAFLRNPVSCLTPLDFSIEVEPWGVPIGSVVDRKPFDGPNMSGCNQVPFDPGIAATPTSKLAGSPSGLDFQLDMPNAGLLSREAIAEGQAETIEVTLPEGMTVNPSQGDGLVGCSPEDLKRETVNSAPGFGCPEASKVGEVQFSTPLLKEGGRGSLYIATPFDNPYESLINLYMVARIPERGVLIKQTGIVEPDPVTGQLTAAFEDVPQVPLTSVNVRLRGGARGALVTPPACGSYDVIADFLPWSASDLFEPDPGEIVTRTSSFEIERGVDGGACPSGATPPFHPGLNAGTINNAAKSYSPFNLRLTRKDGEQEFTNFSIKLPPGVIGKLAGIDVCPDAAIAAARARTGRNGAQEELDSPSCPANSQLGRTLAGSGVGASLTYVPGKVYLAGPYNGAKLSVVAITAAKVGPFDLGTVVIREALKVNPDTAEVFVDPTASDPLPHIIQGIEVHLRDIRVYLDRPEFMFNPTNCDRTSTASTVLGSGLDFASAADNEPVTVTSPFQAADCASLGFKPKLTLQLMGGTKRGDTPRLKAILKPRKSDANIGKVQVTLPHSAFLEQAHIRTVCTRVQFNAGGGNGEKCPKGSIYGKAKAITPVLDEPFRGNVFLRSSNHELPDLVVALHSSKADFNLVGRIDSLNGRIRNTYESPPDVPVTKFVLELQGGQKGLIVNSTNICKGKHRAIANFDGQNGRFHDFKPVVKAKCGGKKGKARAH